MPFYFIKSFGLYILRTQSFDILLGSDIRDVNGKALCSWNPWDQRASVVSRGNDAGCLVPAVSPDSEIRRCREGSDRAAAPFNAGA